MTVILEVLNSDIIAERRSGSLILHLFASAAIEMSISDGAGSWEIALLVLNTLLSAENAIDLEVLDLTASRNCTVLRGLTRAALTLLDLSIGHCRQFSHTHTLTDDRLETLGRRSGRIGSGALLKGYGTISESVKIIQCVASYI